MIKGYNRPLGALPPGYRWKRHRGTGMAEIIPPKETKDVEPLFAVEGRFKCREKISAMNATIH